MRVQYFSVRRHQCRRPWGVGSGRTGSVRGVNDRSWGGFPLSGVFPPRVPISASCTPPFPSCPLTLPFLLSPLLHARARCGRRRLGQVRLSLGFNIGENTGFYLIARYLALRGKRVVWGVVESRKRRRKERTRKTSDGARKRRIVNVDASDMRISSTRQRNPVGSICGALRWCFTLTSRRASLGFVFTRWIFIVGKLEPLHLVPNTIFCMWKSICYFIGMINILFRCKR